MRVARERTKRPDGRVASGGDEAEWPLGVGDDHLRSCFDFHIFVLMELCEITLGTKFLAPNGTYFGKYYVGV